MRTSRFLRWGKSDYVVLDVILWLAFAASLALGVVRPSLGIAGFAGVPTRWEAVVSRNDGELVAAPDAVASTGPNVTVLGVDRVMVEFNDPTLVQRVLLFLPDLMAGIGVAIAVFLVIQMARTLRAGDPFASGNFGRVLAIGAIIAIGSVLMAGVETFTAVLLNEDAMGFPAAITEIPVAGIVAGLIIMGFAEVFILGRKLREDTEGLV